MAAPGKTQNGRHLFGCHRNNQNRTHRGACFDRDLGPIRDRPRIRTVACFGNGRLSCLLVLGLLKATVVWNQTRNDFSSCRSGHSDDFSIHAPWWSVVSTRGARPRCGRSRPCRNVDAQQDRNRKDRESWGPGLIIGARALRPVLGAMSALRAVNQCELGIE